MILCFYVFWEGSASERRKPSRGSRNQITAGKKIQYSRRRDVEPTPLARRVLSSFKLSLFFHFIFYRVGYAHVSRHVSSSLSTLTSDSHSRRDDLEMCPAVRYFAHRTSLYKSIRGTAVVTNLSKRAAAQSMAYMAMGCKIRPGNSTEGSNRRGPFLHRLPRPPALYTSPSALRAHTAHLLPPSMVYISHTS